MDFRDSPQYRNDQDAPFAWSGSTTVPISVRLRWNSRGICHWTCLASLPWLASLDYSFLRNRTRATETQASSERPCD
jgi:hypothetical protein